MRQHLNQKQQEPALDLLKYAAEHKHGEAFMVMQYQCKKCAKVELIWNSRDGVSPFCIRSLCCKDEISQHGNWNSDSRSSNLPPLINGKGVKRVFVSCTKERALELSKAKFADHGEKMMDEYPHLKRIGKDKLISQGVEQFYGDGNQPTIVSIKEYLAAK